MSATRLAGRSPHMQPLTHTPTEPAPRDTSGGRSTHGSSTPHKKSPDLLAGSPGLSPWQRSLQRRSRYLLALIKVNSVRRFFALSLAVLFEVSGLSMP